MQKSPNFNFSRLLYLITGGVQASIAGDYLLSLRSQYPNLEVRVFATPSALKFVTELSLGLARYDFFVDQWSWQRADHVEIAQWADSALVLPASFNFIARLSQGFGDSPALLALQCMDAPVAVCPGLPPGGIVNPSLLDNLDRLAQRKNFTIVPPKEGRSVSLLRSFPGAAADLPTALMALEDLRRDLNEV